MGPDAHAHFLSLHQKKSVPMVCFWGSPPPRLAGGFLFFRYKEQCLAAAMDDYCVKPVQAKNLFQTMAEVLRKYRG